MSDSSRPDVQNATPQLETARPWLELELKIREFHFKRSSEFLRHSVEYGRLVVTNLIWLNSAGLGSLPVIAKFIGIDGRNLSEKLPILAEPAIYFGTGLLAAIMCALIAYYNFQQAALCSDAELLVEINQMKMLLPEIFNHENVRQQIGESIKTFLERFTSQFRLLRFSYWASLLSGLISAGCFIRACWLLVAIDPSSV